MELEDQPEEDPAKRRLGSVLHDKWTLERVLGSGGMGAVYAARHRNGARAAVKVLHPELARRADVRERFLREGYAANRVEHRGAVQVLDDDVVKEGPDEGMAYIVMEMLEGESLEERWERGPPLTELELLRVLNDVLDVLVSAHEHGVVHRDLKPANLFLNKDPAGFRVKVLDFGLARLAEVRSMTSAGLALGTPAFMAPEQANGKKEEIDARTDIFALGATAFMILTGRSVHEADGVLELVARMGTLPAPKLREVAPHVSEHTARIVDRALEFKREDRYSTAERMRADVQAALDELAPASPEPTAALEESAASARTLMGGHAAQITPRGSGSRGLFVLALAGLVVAGVGLALVVPRARDGTLGEGGPASASADPRSAPSPPPPPSGSAASSEPMTPVLMAGDADVAAEGDAATDASADPSADASSDASADEDEDDDDLDASAEDAATSAPLARPAPATAAPHAPATKHTKPAAPGRRKHRPNGPRKPRRPLDLRRRQ